MSGQVNPASSSNPIYTVGGTLRLDRGVYITRKADQEFLDLCRAGEYAYLLNARQLGKSSLMERTARRLEEEGVRTVRLDLTAWGSNISAEQWVKMLLRTVAQRLKLAFDLATWWQEQEELSVTSRMTAFFRDELLTHFTGRVVIFIDEIDYLIGQPFADDVFAGLRSLYNERSDHPDLTRLAFVLIGVALPSELVSDPKHTPFNIAKRVDLSDFTLEEAKPLAAGFGLSEKESLQTLGWVLGWTSGHPYLTQRICKEIADRQSDGEKLLNAKKITSQARMMDKATVNQIVHDLFFGARSGEDSHLKFVEQQLLERAPLAAREPLLQTYREIVIGRRIKDEERSVIKDNLKLFGVVRRAQGALQVRNRIYAQAFNRQWVDEHLPPVPWRKWLADTPNWARWLMVAVCLLGIGLAVSTGWAINRSVEANNARATAQAEAVNSSQAKATSEAEAKRALAAENLAQAHQIESEQQRERAIQQANIALSRQLSAQSIEQFNNGDPTLAMLLALEALTRTQTSESINALNTVYNAPVKQLFEADVLIDDSLKEVRWNEDESDVLALGESISVLNSVSGEPRYTFHQSDILTGTSLSDDKSQEVTWQVNGTVEIWDKNKNQRKSIFSAESPVLGAEFDPHGDRVLTWSVDGKLRAWDTKNGELLFTIPFGKIAWASWGGCGGAFPEKCREATVSISDGEMVHYFDKSGELLEHIALQGISPPGGEFNQDGSQAVTWSDGGTIRIWDVKKDLPIASLDYKYEISHVSFSKNGSKVLIVKVGWDCTISLDCAIDVWDAQLRTHLVTLQHDDRIDGIRFSSDDSQVLTWAGNHPTEIKIWDLQSGKQLFALTYEKKIDEVTWSEDNSRAIILSEGTPILLSTSDRSSLVPFKYSGRAIGVAWKKNSQQVLIWGDSTGIWDADSGRQLVDFSRNQTVAEAIWSSDESKVVTRYQNGSIAIWDVQSTNRLYLSITKGEINGMRLSKDAKRLLTWSGRERIRTSSRGMIRILDTTNEQDLVEIDFKGVVDGALWNKDESQVLAWNKDGKIRVWQINNNRTQPVSLQQAYFGREPIWNGYKDRILTWNGYEGTPGRSTVGWIWDVNSGTKLSTLSHGGIVEGAQWNNDGKRLLTWTDHNLVVWDTSSGEQLNIMEQENVWDAAWSQDNNHVIVVSSVISDNYETQTIAIWDANKKTQSVILGSVGSVRFDVYNWSDDGSRLVTGNTDGTFASWDANTGQKVATFYHQHEDEKVQLKPMNTLIGEMSPLMIRNNDSVDLLTLDFMEPKLHTILYQRDAISDAFLSKNGKWALIQTISGTVILKGVESNKIFRFEHSGKILGFEKEEEQQPLLIWSLGGTVEVWDENAARLLTTIQHNGVNGAKWNKEQSQILTWGVDGTARVWSMATGEELKAFRHQEEVFGALWNAASDKVLTWSKDNTVGVWDVATGQRLVTLFHQDEVDGASWDEKQIGTWSKDHTIVFWDINSATRLATMDIGGRIKTLSGYAGDLFTWREDGVASFWDKDTHKQQATVQLEGEIMVVPPTYGSLMAVTANTDGTLMTWNALTGEKLQTQNVISGVIWGTLSENADYLLTVGYDGAFWVWDAKLSKQVSILEYEAYNVEDNPIQEVQWDTNNHRLGMQIADVFTVWDIDTGKRLSVTTASPSTQNKGVLNNTDPKSLTWDGNIVSVMDKSKSYLIASLSLADPVRQAELSQDGNQVLIRSDNLLTLWTINKAQLWLEGCENTIRQLSGEEWNSYFVGEPFRPTCPTYTHFLGAAKRFAAEGKVDRAEQLFARAIQVAAEQDHLVLTLDPRAEILRYALPPLASKANAAALACNLTEATALYQQVKTLDPSFFQGAPETVVEKLATQAGCSLPSTQ